MFRLCLAINSASTWTSKKVSRKSIAAKNEPGTLKPGTRPLPPIYYFCFEDLGH